MTHGDYFVYVSILFYHFLLMLMVGGIFLFLFQLNLHCVKALAIYAVDVGLGDESVRVDKFHDAEDCHRLNLAAPYHKNLHLLFRVPPPDSL